MPTSEYRGILRFGDIEVECHVLDTEQRVITQRGLGQLFGVGAEQGYFGRSIGRIIALCRRLALEPNTNAERATERGAKHGLPGSSIDQNPNIHARLDAVPIMFHAGQPGVARGYDAEAVMRICEALLAAREHGWLRQSQLPLAQRAEKIVRACARVGLVALIDEATGYQLHRRKADLQQKFYWWLTDDFHAWTRVFHPEFYEHIERWYGRDYDGKRPPYHAQEFTHRYVYAKLDPDVAGELKRRNPQPEKGRNLHQLFSPKALDLLQRYMDALLPIMRLARDRPHFERLYRVAFRESGQLEWLFDVEA